MNYRQNPNTYKSDFKHLAKMEPELLELEAAVIEYSKKNKRKKNFCANAPWYGYGSGKGINFKDGVRCLVGWYAVNDNPKIKTSQAYDAVYIYLYNLLPDCIHDGACR